LDDDRIRELEEVIAKQAEMMRDLKVRGKKLQKML